MSQPPSSKGLKVIAGGAASPRGAGAAASAAGKVGLGVAAVQAFQTVVGFLETWQKAKTERRRIDALRDVEIAQIRERTRVILAYLDRAFEERQRVYLELFERLDRALEARDAQAVALVADAITRVAVQSPFQVLADREATQRALQDPNHTWEL